MLIHVAPRSTHSGPRRSGGFTIIELALGLVIVAMLASAMLVPLVTQVTQRKVAATERILEQAVETLVGYATATGRLPCPATTASLGVEDFATGGDASNGRCETYYGFLPAVTLGFTPIDSDGFALDGWATPPHNRLRYAVARSVVWPPPTDPADPRNNVFTRTGGIRAVRADVVAAAQLFHVCSNGSTANATEPSPTCGAGAVTLTTNAPAIIWSNGANAATGGTGTDELQNPSPTGGTADRIFVSRTRGGSTSNDFDDVVSWLSVGALVSRMVLGGQLP